MFPSSIKCLKLRQFRPSCLYWSGGQRVSTGVLIICVYEDSGQGPFCSFCLDVNHCKTQCTKILPLIRAKAINMRQGDLLTLLRCPWWTFRNEFPGCIVQGGCKATPNLQQSSSAANIQPFIQHRIQQANRPVIIMQTTKTPRKANS